MTNPNKNTNLSELVYILDRSGSMSGMEEAAAEAFNQFVEEQQKVEGDATLTQVLFDTEFEKPVDARPIGEVTQMETADFKPRGCTALLDAIGLSIKATRKRIKAMPEGEQPATVVFAIFTDGHENSSQQYTWEKVAKRIKRRTEQDGWQFLFLAANQDAIATAAKMNIHRDNSATVEFCVSGVSSQGAAFNRKTSALRRRGAGLVEDSHEDLVTPMADIAAEEHVKKEKADRARPATSDKS
jgi:hypothetical protein